MSYHHYSSSNNLLVEQEARGKPKIPALPTHVNISHSLGHPYTNRNILYNKKERMTVLWKHSCFWLSMTSALLVADAFAGIQPSTRSKQHHEQRHTQPKTTTALSLSSTTTTTTTTTNTNDSLLQPTYDIERIPIRIGHGFDIHRMAPLEEAGQPLIIGGVHVTHKDQKWTDKDGKYVEAGGIYETQLGVVAHSDGDVIYHSIVDAIFGALTLPDIGQVFQDTDPRWKQCDSSKFMEHAYGIMKEYGYSIGNIDVTLILERPKVATFKPAMKDNIVTLLHTTPGRVNIKARTHEQVDSVGELRSLSCHVVLTLELSKSE